MKPEITNTRQLVIKYWLTCSRENCLINVNLVNDYVIRIRLPLKSILSVDSDGGLSLAHWKHLSLQSTGKPVEAIARRPFYLSHWNWRDTQSSFGKSNLSRDFSWGRRHIRSPEDQSSGEFATEKKQSQTWPWPARTWTICGESEHANHCATAPRGNSKRQCCRGHYGIVVSVLDFYQEVSSSNPTETLKAQPFFSPLLLIARYWCTWLQFYVNFLEVNDRLYHTRKIKRSWPTRTLFRWRIAWLCWHSTCSHSEGYKFLLIHYGSVTDHVKGGEIKRYSSDYSNATMPVDYHLTDIV